VQILWFDSLPSTQTYLKEKLRSSELKSPVAVVAELQTEGIGSRGNSWTGLEGNLFFSFAISRHNLASDLLLESASIYFAYLLKELLEEEGSALWLKWPNDFYLENTKIGGVITFLRDDDLICGMGLNLLQSPDGFNHLDVNINKKELLDKFFKKIENKVSWKQIFSKFKVEFGKSKQHKTTVANNKISLDNAELNSDGSLSINGERIYSLR
jgi:BirA family biotin operon repressor/biotin-[acetyl-CoA-carboxylase] ligase